MTEALPSAIPTSVIATIDFEGSSLHGYPIEVGVALWDRAADEIRVWSRRVISAEISPLGSCSITTSPAASTRQAGTRIGTSLRGRPQGEEDA